jgi:hypothetical protein
MVTREQCLCLLVAVLGSGWLCDGQQQTTTSSTKGSDGQQEVPLVLSLEDVYALHPIVRARFCGSSRNSII